MEIDEVVTDVTGLAVILLGLVSLTESALQVQLLGRGLPMIQGSLVSLFVVSFGAVLLTEDASEAFKKFREACQDMV